MTASPAFTSSVRKLCGKASVAAFAELRSEGERNMPTHTKTDAARTTRSIFASGSIKGSRGGPLRTATHGDLAFVPTLGVAAPASATSTASLRCGFQGLRRAHSFRWREDGNVLKRQPRAPSRDRRRRADATNRG